MNTLPRLQGLSLRPETEPGFEKELWQPTWKCFCCHDTGLVYRHLVGLVIEDYDEAKHKHPYCQNCARADDLASLVEEYKALDARFTPALCAELDEFERENWRQSLISKIKARQVNLSRIGQNLRLRERSPQEQQLAAVKHRQIINQ